MLDPPMDTKGKVTPVSGSRSTAPSTFSAIWHTSMAAVAQERMV